MEKQPTDKKNIDRRYVTLGLRIVGDFGAVIAVPVVLFAMIGKRLDSVYGTKPWLTVLGFVLAAALSAVVIKRRAVAYGKEYQALIDSEKSSSK